MARVITAPGIVRNVSKYLNSMRRVPFAIGKDDWTEVDSSTYTYEFVTAYITTSSFDIGTFDNSVLSYANGNIPSAEKKDGGGGMVFTTTKRPTGTVSGSIYIWDNNDNKVPVILEGTTVPIENGGTDATSVLGILSNLGLGSANDAQETLDFGDAVHKDVANNVTTTSEGYLLDARQGKVLKDSVDELNSNLNTVSSSTVTINTTNIDSVNENSVERCGKLVILRMQFNFKTTPTVGTAVNVGTIPSGYCPKVSLETYALGAGSAWKETDLASINIGSNGGISVTQRRTAQNNWVKFYISYFI